MKKRTFLLTLVLTALVFVGYAVAAGGDASDPLISLDFLNGTFRRQAFCMASGKAVQAFCT